jgi:hypothetical protein
MQKRHLFTNTKLFWCFKTKIAIDTGQNAGAGAGANSSAGTGFNFQSVGAIISFRICKNGIYSPILSSFDVLKLKLPLTPV